MSNIRDRMWEKAGINHVPITAAFELLPLCNLSCKMCYVRKTRQEVDASGGFLPGSQWLMYAREAQKLGLLFPLLTGGEPLLHPDFKEIFIGMQELGMQISINSNGTLIDEKMARWFAEHTPTRINITLYGASHETYKRLCGNAVAFDKVRNAVKLLKYYHIPIKFNASITPDNVDDLHSMILFAQQEEIPIQIATYMFPPLRRDASMVGINARLTPGKAGLARVLADYWQGDPQWFLGQAKRFSHFVEPNLAIKEREDTDISMHMTCRAGVCSFWIDWQGNMMNCGMYGSAKISLDHLSIAKAWEDLREQTEEVSYQPVCLNCVNRSLCHPCVAMINNECGDLNGRPTYLCEMNAAAARYYAEYAKKLPVQLDDTVDMDTLDLRECDIDEF